MRACKPLVVLGALMFLGGCGDGPHPRLQTLLGKDAFSTQKTNKPEWSHLERVGLLVHSDTTGPKSAPAISTQYLETLGRRTEQMLKQQCNVDSVVSVDFVPSQEDERKEAGTQVFLVPGKELGLSHVLLVVFSSTERGGPTVLGEERMMTQMSGTSIENTALAEVGLFRLADTQLLIEIPAGAQETLELLDAPIGEGQPSRDESIDILRAQAAQQALDKSLRVFGQWCQGVPEKP